MAFQAALSTGGANTGAEVTAPSLRLTILIPCLDEAETIAACIGKALSFLERSKTPGEVLVADNGSKDGSAFIARQLGARVVDVVERGYGNALRGGVAAARGRFIIMGDADDSYDFSNLSCFLDALDGGADLVMGNRFKGGIARGAMPLLHRYLGNPVLSWLGRLFFSVPIGDFHCGLRGFRRDSVVGLGLKSDGMEFASEMVVQAALRGLRITEVPTTLQPDGRSRAPHLRTWRDGWRHLRFLLLHSPRWAFIHPGIAAMAAGFFLVVTLLGGRVELGGGVSLDIRAFLVGCMLILVGSQGITFGLIARRFAGRNALLPRHDRLQSLLDAVTMERLLLAATVLGGIGLSGLFFALGSWIKQEFGSLDEGQLLREMLLSLTAVVAAVQLGFYGLLLGV